ncbi:MAG: hypothetical protein H8E98_01925 [Bacteroidetes bacterium]|nr:hypothetical protein [Bacteroidota bacterium]
MKIYQIHFLDNSGVSFNQHYTSKAKAKKGLAELRREQRAEQKEVDNFDWESDYELYTEPVVTIQQIFDYVHEINFKNTHNGIVQMLNNHFHRDG